jgi:hypothetical protein
VPSARDSACDLLALFLLLLVVGPALEDVVVGRHALRLLRLGRPRVLLHRRRRPPPLPQTRDLLK